jgi:hypothetical protein
MAPDATQLKLISDIKQYLNNDDMLESQIARLQEEQRGCIIPDSLFADPSLLIMENYASEINNLSLFSCENLNISPAGASYPGSWFILNTCRINGTNKEAFNLTYQQLKHILSMQNLLCFQEYHSFLINLESPTKLLSSLDEAFTSLATSIIQTSQTSFVLSPSTLPNSDQIQVDHWRNLWGQWANTPVARIPGNILRKLFCSFARSDQYIKPQLLNIFRDCLILLLSKAEEYLLSHDPTQAERYYLKFLLLPSIILSKPKSIPNGYNRISYQIQILNSIKEDNWDIQGLLLKDIATRPDDDNSLPTITQNNSQFKRDQRIISFLDDNLIGRASNALISTPLAEKNLETYHQLQLKHPAAPNPYCNRNENLTNSDQYSAAIFEHFNPIALRNFIKHKPKRVATGNSNIRWEHLQQLMSSSNSIPGNLFLDVFSRFCGFFVAGKLPNSIHTIISEGSIFAIKKEAGIRPVVTKDTLSKLIGLVIDKDKSEIINLFEPINFSYSKSGIEKIIHSIKQKFNNDNGVDTISIDISNAHNSVDRNSARDAIEKYFPIYLPYFDSTYGNQSNLYFQCNGNNYLPVVSSCGFHQGDPFASLGFNLATLDPIKEALESLPNKEMKGITVCYHDDLYIQNTFSNNISFLQTLIPTLEGINLKINLTKSKIYLSKYETIDEITRIKNAYRSIGFEDCNIFTHPENMILLDSPDSRDTFGLVVLGTPVGTEEFIKSSLKEKLSKIENDLSSLLSFNGGSHRKFTLLQQSFSKKINHLLRTINPHITHEFTSSFDDLILNSLNEICNLSTPVNSNAATQAKLPITMSGLGLGNNSLIKHAAFLASESICYDTLLTLINNFKHSEDFDNSLTLLNERINQYKTEKHQSITVDPLDLRLSTSYGAAAANICSKHIIIPEDLHALSKDSKLQNYLSTHLYRSEFNTLITSNSTNEKACSRLISCSQYGSGIHFTACPKSNTWSICSDDEFNISISLRLGLPINGIPLFSKCNNCKSNSHLDSLGYHFLNCPFGGHRLKIHNTIVREISHICKSIGASTAIDNLGYIFPGSNHRPDLHVSNCESILSKLNKSSAIQKSDIFGDVTIINPCCDSNLSSSSLTPLHSANAAYNNKLSKYSTLMENFQPNGVFLPLVMEIFGALHSKFRYFLSLFIADIAFKLSIDQSILFTYYLKRIGMLLAKSTAQAIIFHRNRSIHIVDRPFSYPRPLLNPDEFVHFSSNVNHL